MKTVVMGKKIKNNYDVVVEKDEDGKYLSRPEIKKLEPDIKWEQIYEYEGTAQYGIPETPSWLSVPFNRRIYLSENEEVRVTKQIFRADLGQWFQYTDKVLEEKDGNLKSCEKNLKALLADYNKQKIEDDEDAKAYCDLHKLKYEESDYDEIIKIIGKKKCTYSFTPPTVVSKGTTFSLEDYRMSLDIINYLE